MRASQGRIFATVLALAALVGSARAELGPERISCRNPLHALRSGKFELQVGTVQLRNGKGCAFLESECDWNVALTRVQAWGPKFGPRLLLVVVNASHIHGSGAWDSVLVYRCQDDRYVLAYSDRFLYGAKVALGAKADFWLTAGVWREADANCCPSLERRRHFVWRAAEERFVATESTERRLDLPK